MDRMSFHYQATCTAPGCNRAATYKVAAPWTNALSQELKNYGLACEEHRDSQLQVAREHRDSLNVAEEESVGPVELYRLVPGRRDVELSQIG
ncbi:hypothetical protein [Singulisphaera sp. PoT]|uniref:hypothetical protein n=1 Tax=Singulisphaera sp. PoT TaxID=3411797 RepID=UPI003BF60B9B